MEKKIPVYSRLLNSKNLLTASLFRNHPDHGAYDLLQGNASVLESIFVIIMIMVVIVRVQKEQVLFSENKPGTHIRPWQSRFLRIDHLEHILFVVIQVSTYLIPQVSCRLPITNNFGRLVNADSTVISCYNKTNSHVQPLFVKHSRVENSGTMTWSGTDRLFHHRQVP